MPRRSRGGAGEVFGGTVSSSNAPPPTAATKLRTAIPYRAARFAIFQAFGVEREIFAIGLLWVSKTGCRDTPNAR